MVLANRVGLWIGNSFAEASVDTKLNVQSNARWYLPRTPLLDGLKNIFTEIGVVAQDAGTLTISTSRPRWLLERNQSSVSLACLVTDGFENWIHAHANEAMDLDEASVIAVKERTRANGDVETELDPAALEAIADKLIEKQIQNVALTFLHANLNPSNEKKADEILRAKGLKVFASHRLSNLTDERERWRRALECALVEPLWNDEIAQLKTLIEESLSPKWKTEIWCDDGLRPLSEARIENVWSGVDASLKAASPAGATHLYLGIEDFYLVGAAGGGAVTCRFTELQPTLEIGPSEWAFPTFTNRNRGYEPGPFVFGKSHQVTLIDLLAVCGKLASGIEGLSDRISERVYPRVLEAFYTMGKNAGHSPLSPSDSRLIAADLEKAASENLVLDCASMMANEVSVYGAFSDTLLPRMKAVVTSQLSLKAAPAALSAWCFARATQPLEPGGRT